MCRTTFALGCTGFMVETHLFPLHEILSTHTERMCRQTRRHKCTLHLWYGPTQSFQKMFVSFSYFSMVIVRNCWNIKGCITVLLRKLIWRQCKWRYCWFVYFVWIPPQWRFWVLHAQVCFSLSLQPIRHYVTAIWQIFHMFHNDLWVYEWLIGLLWNCH